MTNAYLNTNKKPKVDQSNTNTAKVFSLLITLYLAQGLPLGFITQALPAILREYDVSLKMIGWTGILLAPWALKFLWAPIVDNLYHPKIGQSRSWILPMQLISAILLCVIAFMDPTTFIHIETLRILFFVLFFINLCGASHDIATDAFTTRTLSSDTYSVGSSAQVIGYRMGLIFGGGLFLMVMDYLSWQTSFMLLAGFILLNTLPIFLHRENRPNNKPIVKNVTHINQHPTSHSTYHWFKVQFGYFWQNKEMRAWLLVLLTFKITDGMSSGMVKPMMTDMGLSLKQIGLWGSVLGSTAALSGAAIAAIIMRHISPTTALILFNFLQSLTTGFYAVCGYYFEKGKQLGNWLVYFANAIEHLAAAMALVAMLSTVMHYSRNQQAGSDFTFQVCMLVLLSGNAHIISGYIAESLGYTGLFSLSMLVGIILLLPIIYWRRLKLA